MKRLGALLASLLLAGSLTACGGTAAQEMQSIQVFAMDTVMALQATGGETKAALQAAGAIGVSDDGKPVANNRLLLEALRRAGELGPGRTAQCPG